MEIFSRNRLVGRLDDPIPDMWYLEGHFTPAETEAGEAFAERARQVDTPVALIDHTKAIRAVLQETTDRTNIHFVILGLRGDRMFGRRVIGTEAERWTLANVPE